MTPARLLVATDFSTDARLAALRAGALARQHGAGAVALLHAVPDLGVAAELALRASGAIRDALELLAAEVERACGVPFRPILAERPVDSAVLEAAAQSDLILIGARGQNPVRDLVIGTTADRLIRKARRPVMVVRTAPEGPYRHALAAVDFSPDSVAAVRIAAALAPAARLEVVHAYDTPYEGSARMAGASDDDLLRYRALAKAQAEAQMAELIASAGVSVASASCLPGHPLLLIPARAKALGCDLLAVGKHGRGALEELLLGSTTQHLLASARCDVLVVPAAAR
jgi:nucleotide-binding universal stress UspA family protein